MKSVFSKLELDETQAPREQLQRFIRELILSGKLRPGERLPSTEELAVRSQSYVPAVHAALTALVKEGLLVRQHGRGTFVRQREAKLTCVGIYDRAAGGRSPYLQALHAALKEELTQAGIEMDVWIDPRPEGQVAEPWMPLVNAASHREFQALIAVGVDRPRLRWLPKLPVPTAFQTSAVVPSSVGWDVRQFADLSLQALRQQNCRSVGLICPWPTAVTNPDGSRHMYTDFFECFSDLAHDLGLMVKNDWMRVAHHERDRSGRSAEQFGYEEFLRLWGQPKRPEGLVVYDDVVARGVILGLQAQQVRVPEDLKLVLHKNESIELLCPMPATFVVSSERAMAKALIEQIQKQFRGECCEPISLPFRRLAHPGRSRREINNEQPEGSQL